MTNIFYAATNLHVYHSRNMFDDTRKFTTIVFLSALLFSIIICFIKFDKRPKLTILIMLLLVQFVSSIWYSLSYIPFARRTVLKCCEKNLGLNDG